jgi:hypothetical protein
VSASLCSAGYLFIYSAGAAVLFAVEPQGMLGSWRKEETKHVNYNDSYLDNIQSKLSVITVLRAIKDHLPE